jgi:hypothetical protein
VGHGQESRAASSLAARAVKAKPAGGILANPASRPGDMHSARGPGPLPPGQYTQGQNIQAMGAARTEFAGVSTASELWRGAWLVLA